MPAIITHDLFAKDIYGEVFESIGGSRDEAEAFLLGNQGPDPLFFVGADVRYRAWRNLGSTIHRARPSEFLVALKRGVAQLPAHERSWGRAYVLGFACHYLLDRTVHPLVFSQERALTAAGVEGLTPADHSEVHAVIETDLDEMALAAKRGETVASFNPAKAVLKGREAMLSSVSRLYAAAVPDAFGIDVPGNLFRAAVKAERAAQRVVYSPAGIKRRALSALERTARPHSLLAALSHRGDAQGTTPFANGDHRPWQHPFTDAVSTADFWDLYEQARTGALAAIAALDDDGFNAEAARRLTADINFHGEPVVAVVMAVEDAAPADAALGAEDDRAC